MDLYEYQARDLFEKYGVPVLPGIVADTPEDVRAAAEQLGGVVVVKAQVKTGGRRKSALIADCYEALIAAIYLDGGFEPQLAEDARPAACAVSTPASRAASRSVRLNVDLLDRMMSGMSDKIA